MFKAKLTDSKLLKTSIDAISNLIDEAGISVDKNGLKLKAMDPAHVCLVDLEIGKEAFDEFKVDESREKPLILGIALDRLNTILKRAGMNDEITLEWDEEKNMLKIKLKNSSQRTFNLPLLDISEEELKIPDLEDKFNGRVEVLPEVIREGIKDAEIVSGHVTLKMDSEFLYIIAKGDLGNVEVKVSKDDAIEFKSKEEVNSMYSIEYLRDIIKASAIAKSVKISLGTNIPVKTDFLTENAKLSFLLAPRIESE